MVKMYRTWQDLNEEYENSLVQGETIDDWECPSCGQQSEPIIDTTLEGTDADGRRGQWYDHITCPMCGHEESWPGALQ